MIHNTGKLIGHFDNDVHRTRHCCWLYVNALEAHSELGKYYTKLCFYKDLAI